MRIVMNENNVYEFELSKYEAKLIFSAKNFEEAKKIFLDSIEHTIDKEINKMLIEFSQQYNLDKDTLL